MSEYTDIDVFSYNYKNSYLDMAPSDLPNSFTIKLNYYSPINSFKLFKSIEPESSLSNFCQALMTKLNLLEDNGNLTPSRKSTQLMNPDLLLS